MTVDGGHQGTMSVKGTKACVAGERTFRARVLRVWVVGGLRMCLVGDESGLTRVETGEAAVERGRSYEFTDATVRHYPGGWTSLSIADGGSAIALSVNVHAPQDEAYIERTFKIVSGVQRKKGRREGRLPAWQHPTEASQGRQHDKTQRSYEICHKRSGWFDARWHFSFDYYYDPGNTSLGTMRVS